MTDMPQLHTMFLSNEFNTVKHLKDMNSGNPTQWVQSTRN